MLKTLSKIALVTLIPKIANDVYDHFFKSPPVITTKIEPPKLTKSKVKKKKNKYKKPDHTPFTKEMYDYAISSSIKNSHLTNKALTEHLNNKFGTNKSVSSMKRLFTGKVIRDKLPESGKKY